jgi:membrane protein
MKTLRAIYGVLRDTVTEWLGDNMSTQAAALAYYAAFALAPLAVLALAIAGFLFGEEAARGELYHRLEGTAGPTFARAIEHSLQYVHGTEAGAQATVISIGFILVGAMGLFTQLQHSLNVVWGVPPKEERRWWGMIKDRLLSFIIMVFVSLLLPASLISTTVIQTLDTRINQIGVTLPLPFVRFANYTIFFILTALIIAAIYKLLPNISVPWRDVWLGSVLTTILFLIGNYLIGLYLSKSGATSAYGAAGSLVVILLWVNYSAQVLLFGAEFTQVYARRYGSSPIQEKPRLASAINPPAIEYGTRKG